MGEESGPATGDQVPPTQDPIHRRAVAAARASAEAIRRTLAARGLLLGRCLALLAAVGIGVMTWNAGRTVVQWSDHLAVETLLEAAALARSEPIPQTGFGPSVESRCGLFHLTHHPIGGAYVLVPWLWFGGDAYTLPLIGVVVATVLMLARFAWIAPLHSLLASAYIAMLLDGALGYASWLTNLQQHTWNVVLLYGLATVATLRRPIWWVVVLISGVAWIGYDAVFLQAATLAAVMFATHGIGLRTIVTGVAAIGTFALMTMLHVLQVWCYFGFSWDAAWGDWGSGGLMARVSPHPWPVRLMLAKEIAEAYTQAFVVLREWSMPWVWLGAAALLALCPVTLRGSLAAALIPLAYVAWAIVVPYHLIPHLHLMPRWLLFGPLLIIIVQGAGAARTRQQSV